MKKSNQIIKFIKRNKWILFIPIIFGIAGFFVMNFFGAQFLANYDQFDGSGTFIRVYAPRANAFIKKTVLPNDITVNFYVGSKSGTELVNFVRLRMTGANGWEYNCQTTTCKYYDAQWKGTGTKETQVNIPSAQAYTVNIRVEYYDSNQDIHYDYYVYSFEMAEPEIQIPTPGFELFISIVSIMICIGLFKKWRNKNE